MVSLGLFDVELMRSNSQAMNCLDCSGHWKRDASEGTVTNTINLLAAGQAAREHSRAATHLFALEPVLPFSRKQ